MSANKEVKVTFTAIDKTKIALKKMRWNFEQLQHQLSKIKLGFGTLGNAITAAFSGAALKKIIDNGEQIGKLSDKLGIATTHLSELQYITQKCGVEFDSLTTALDQMQSNLVLATVNSGSAKDALKLLELNAWAIFNLKPADQMAKIAEGLLRVSNELDRAQLAIQIFGEEGAKLLPIINQGADGIKNLQEEAQKLGAVLSKEECDAMAKFNEELTRLQVVLTSLITAVLIPILPMLTDFFEAIREGHPAITFLITAASTLLVFKLAAWFIGATIAIRGFTIALMANPLGLIAVAISAVIAGLVSLTSWFNKSTKAAEEAAAKYKKTVKVIEGITYTTITPVEETKKALAPITIPKIPKAQIANMGESNKLLTEAKQIFEQTRTPLERHNTQMAKLNNLLKQGLINQDTFNRAMDQSMESLDQTVDKTEEVFSIIKDHSKEAADSLIDNFADATFGIGDKMKSLKETCSDIFNQIRADILKMSIKQGLFSNVGSGGLLGGLLGGGKNTGSSIGSLFAGFFANGGAARAGKAHVVGDGGEPELFIPSSSGSIIPFSKLETVGDNKNNIVVNMNIQTPDVQSFNYSRGQIAADMARQLSYASRNL